ncbi:TPA: phosphodiesterase, partial [Pseudomonas aeruginosa]|nr:phosphodiesterase [Pseudomonas aeruginosa]
MLRSLLLCSLLLAPPLFADTLSIPLGAQGDTRVALPARGESREAVLQ